MFIKIIILSIIALTGAGSASIVAQHALDTNADTSVNIETENRLTSDVEANSNEDLFLRSNIGLPSIESNIEGDIKANSESSIEENGSSNNESSSGANHEINLGGAVNGSLDSSLQANANVSL